MTITETIVKIAECIKNSNNPLHLDSCSTMVHNMVQKFPGTEHYASDLINMILVRDLEMMDADKKDELEVDTMCNAIEEHPELNVSEG